MSVREKGKGLQRLDISSNESLLKVYSSNLGFLKVDSLSLAFKGCDSIFPEPKHHERVKIFGVLIAFLEPPTLGFSPNN